MVTSLVDFAQSLKVSSCRVRNTPNLIFLCGGPASQNPKAPRRCQSVRDYFLWYVRTNRPTIAPRLRLAEDIGRWLDHERFTDLLEVENYLADLAEIIILFVESPGSIAELGAFSALTRVQPKVLAVVNKKFQGPSFIADGPVRRLRELEGSSVYEYFWNPATSHLNDKTNLEVFKELSEQLCDVLEHHEGQQLKEPIFDLESHGHNMLMVADLIDIIFAATMTDIEDCLKALGRNVDRSIIKKYLFLLQGLNIITEEYLDGVFYVTRGCGPYIGFDFKADARFMNRERAKLLVRSNLDKTRARILRRYLRQHGPESSEADHA